MKNLILIVTLFTLSFAANSQTKRETLSKSEIGKIKFSHVMSIKDADTSIYVSMIFKNEKYKTLDESVVVVLVDQAELDQLVLDLKDVKNFIKESGAAELSFTRGQYSIFAMEDKNIFLFNTKKTYEYTSMNKKDIDAMIAFLSNAKLKRY